MKRIVAIAAFSLAGIALAQTATFSRRSFVAVDAVRIDAGSDLLVTGVLDGAASAAEQRVRPYGYAATRPDMAECRRYALLAMSKPGQYLLSFDVENASTTVWYARDCRLERAVP